MSNTKLISKKRLLAALMASVILGAAALTGCSSGSDSSGATVDSVITETQVVTKVVDGVLVDENGNAITDPSGNPIKATDATGTTAKQTSKTDSKQQSSAASGSSKQQSAASGNQQSSASKQASSGSSSKSGNSGQSSSAERKTTPSNAQSGNTTKKSEANNSNTLKMGGKEFKVGDKVTCTYYLMVPEKMLNFQGRVEFDPALLKLEDAYLIAPANFSAILNNNLDNRVVFNGSDLSGYDFTSPGYEFLTVQYTVVKGGTAEPSITFEVLTDIKDKAYGSDNGVLQNGAKVWSVYE